MVTAAAGVNNIGRSVATTISPRRMSSTANFNDAATRLMIGFDLCSVSIANSLNDLATALHPPANFAASPTANHSSPDEQNRRRQVPAIALAASSKKLRKIHAATAE